MQMIPNNEFDGNRRPAMEGIELPWLSNDMQQARESIAHLMVKVNQAYELGIVDAADVIDGELEQLYDFMDNALSDLESDGAILCSEQHMELTGFAQLNRQPGDIIDTEHGPVENLAACYDEVFVRPNPPFGLDAFVDKIAFLRAAIEESGGSHAGQSDNDVIDAAREAYQSIGKEKALRRPGRNPCYEQTLLKAEAVLRGDAGRGKPSIVAGDDSIRQMGDPSEVGESGFPYGVSDSDDMGDFDDHDDGMAPS